MIRIGVLVCSNLAFIAKSNSEKIVLYELWRNILIVLKTHCVI